MRYWLLLALFLLGCQTADFPPATMSVVPTAIASPTAILPTETPSAQPAATATATPLPQPTATAVPTATPAPLTLAVPPEWEAVAKTAVSTLQLAQPWQIVVPDETAVFQLLPDGTANDLLVWQEPIALVVPFTHPLEAIGIDEALKILAEGDPIVTPLAWSAMRPQLRAVAINGRLPQQPDYPLQTEWRLRSRPGFEAIGSQLALALHSSMAEAQATVWLTAVGDIMLDRSLGYALSLGDLAYPFADIVDELTAADLTVGNVESALGDIGEPASKSYPFRAPPAAAQALALAGFDVVSLANNHGMDYGPAALLQGLDLLHEAGVGTVGAGADDIAAHQPHIVTRNGLSLAFLGYVHVPVESRGFDTATWTATATTPGLAWGDPERIMADITAVRSQVDLVVVVLHSGYEYQRDPSPPQMAAAKAAIDAGADLVLGHHAHILQGIEFYKGGVIVYGLGNFAFEIDGPPETAVYHLWLDKNGVRQIQILPAIVQFGGQPRPATAPEAHAIRQQIYQLTEKLNQQ